MLKYLRIAVTALCLAACVLLVALWVRSYWRFDVVQGELTKGRFGRAASYSGGVFLGSTDFNGLSAEFRKWDGVSIPAEDGEHLWKTSMLPREGISVVVPHGVLLLLFVTAAALPWIQCRFSLRTLLIATTLVAAGLAFAVVRSQR